MLLKNMYVNLQATLEKKIKISPIINGSDNQYNIQCIGIISKPL